MCDVVEALWPGPCADVRRHGGEEWHVVFEGADEYYASVPLSRVVERGNDCLLATHMNGEPLSPDHGYPVRALLPGVAGARNVKWLQSVSVQRGPCDSPWNAYYYKNRQGAQIQALPMQSIILSSGARGDSSDQEGPERLHVSGVAYGGGSGNAIARVEVSTDGGATWQRARLQTDEIAEDGSEGCFGWVRWTAELAQGARTVVCRATDSEGNVQPERPQKERGYIYNGWSRVDLK
jgi:sulfite oxidase